MMHRTGHSLVLGAAIAAILGIGHAGLAPHAQAQEMTKLAIGTAKDPNLGAQIVIAREKGYFKGEKLDVEVKYFPSGGDLMAAAVSGDIAYGSAGATPTTGLRSRPYPIKILAQISDISGAQQLIVKESIRTPADLNGKKVALLKGTASEALFNSFAAGYGFDKSKVEIIAMGPTEMLAAFARGDVDAVNLWEPHCTRARKAGNGHILVSGTRSYIPGQEGAKRIYGDHAVLFATEDTIAKNQKTTRAVLRALAKANDFIATSADEANTILAKEFGLDPADMKGIMGVNNYTLVLDDTLVADMNKLADFLESQAKLKGKQNVKDWIDASALKDVRADLVKLK